VVEIGGADAEMTCSSNAMFAVGGSGVGAGVCPGALGAACCSNGMLPGGGSSGRTGPVAGICDGALRATGPMSCVILLMVAIACCSKSLHSTPCLHGYKKTLVSNQH
jgi:hypothetical protein